VQLRAPEEMGGEGGGTNPEQLFAVGYAACFGSAVGVIGRRERVEVGDVSIDSRVSLLPTEERGFKLAAELDVTLPQVQDAEQAARIVAAAHQVCPCSNATRGNIEVTLTVTAGISAEPLSGNGDLTARRECRHEPRFRRVRVVPNLSGLGATRRRQARCSSSQSNMRCSVSSRAIGWQW